MKLFGTALRENDVHNLYLSATSLRATSRRELVHRMHWRRERANAELNDDTQLHVVWCRDEPEHKATRPQRLITTDTLQFAAHAQPGSSALRSLFNGEVCADPAALTLAAWRDPRWMNEWTGRNQRPTD